MIEEVKSIVPIAKAYDDILSPAMKQIGGVLESVAKTARFLFAPIEYVAAYQTRWQACLDKVSAKVKEEDLIEGAPQLVLPTLNGLTLAIENSLISELFVNLLANSIDRTKQGLAHPAFPSIISQLSHDEAVLIYYYKKGIDISEFEIEQAINPATGFPFVIYSKDVLQFPELFGLYRDHLASINIAKLKPRYTSFKSMLDHPEIYDFGEPLTVFGKLFAESCVPDFFENMKY
jgi:hypothetical protein